MAGIAGALAAGMLAIVAPALQGEADAANDAAQNPGALQPVSQFARIKNKEQRAVALFEEAGKVIASPRCMNCHPATDRPTQKRLDAAAPAAGGARRRRPRCRRRTRLRHLPSRRQLRSGPGARAIRNGRWRRIEMAWQGKSLGQICVQIKDRARNGDMDMAELVHHMAEDELVGWGWKPGAGRTPAPGTQKQVRRTDQGLGRRRGGVPEGVSRFRRRQLTVTLGLLAYAFWTIMWSTILKSAGSSGVNGEDFRHRSEGATHRPGATR